MSANVSQDRNLELTGCKLIFTRCSALEQGSHSRTEPRVLLFPAVLQESRGPRSESPGQETGPPDSFSGKSWFWFWFRRVVSLIVVLHFTNLTQ